MHILATDETNLSPSGQARYFIYGGLLLSADALGPLHDRITEIRRAADLRPSDKLKFATRERPDHVDPDVYTAAKQEVITACHDLGVRFMAYLVHHNIATGGQDELVRFAVNTIVSKFNFDFLPDVRDTGIVIFDRLPMKADFDFMREKFTFGITMPNGVARPLSRVHAYTTSCDGASHLSSAVDIVLGAFRYCVNETGRDEISAAIFPDVARMLWGRERAGVTYIREAGLLLRPLNIRAPRYVREYDELVERLGRLAGNGD